MWKSQSGRYTFFWIAIVGGSVVLRAKRLVLVQASSLVVLSPQSKTEKLKFTKIHCVPRFHAKPHLDASRKFSRAEELLYLTHFTNKFSSHSMAPPNQQNGAAKRKRPADAAAVEKKDAIKKSADSTNKRVKASVGDKSAPAKKPFSNALPVAPLSVSKLKGSGKEEITFPRGGGSVLTPLEYKEATNEAARDVLFESGAGGGSKPGRRDVDGDVDMEDGEKKPKQKKRKTEHAKKDKSTKAKEEHTTLKVEGLSFKV